MATEQFLEQYKSFEAVLRGILGPDMTVLRYEDQSSNPEKMRMCRLVRNFLQHTPDAAGFIVPTEEMRRFLKQETVRVAAQAEKAKDLSYRPAPIKLSHTWQQAFRLFVKAGADWLPVVDDKSQLVGVLTKDALFLALSSGKDITATPVQSCYPTKGWKKTLDEYVVCDCEDILPSVPLDKEFWCGVGNILGSSTCGDTILQKWGGNFHVEQENRPGAADMRFSSGVATRS